MMCGIDAQDKKTVALLKIVREHLLQWLTLGWVVLGVSCVPYGVYDSTPVSPTFVSVVVASETVTPNAEIRVTSVPEEPDLNTQALIGSPTVFSTADQAVSAPEKVAPTATQTAIPSSRFLLETNFDTHFQGRMVAIQAESYAAEAYGLVLLDVTTGIFRYLWVQPPDIFVQGFNWTTDGCWFFTLSKRPEGLNVDKVDLYGNLLSRTSFDIPPEDTERLITDWAPSPSGKWVAYIVHSGNRGLYFSDVQDVRAVPVDKNEPVPELLSHGGWNLEPNWSANGEFLAYNDVDESSVVQLFIYHTTSGNKHQLTDFSSSVSRITEILWSPNDDFLAFSANLNDELSLWSVPINGGQARKADLRGLESSQILGWTSKGDSYVAKVKTEEFDNITSNGEIVWIDAQTGDITNSVSLIVEQIPLGTILPIDDSRLLLISEDDIIQFDTKAGNLNVIGKSPFGDPVFELIPDPRIRMGPPNFEGEELCS